MESLLLSPTSANQDLIANLIAVEASPRNVTFNRSIGNDLVRASEVICLIYPFCSPKESEVA